MSESLYPLKFRPIFKHYLWGGRNLRRLRRTVPDGDIVAESWEVADHGSDVSVVESGPLAGWSMRDLIGRFDGELCPPTAGGRFPLLVKYIDAARRLSVQVHPDDRYAAAHESPGESGKNECWYVLDARPGAELILGLREGVTRERFRRMLAENRIEEGLARRPINAGDFIFIRTGTVHAILEGVMVCEVQQNSDTTYRLYDWGRVDADGGPRPLHVDRALDVIEFPPEDGYCEYLESLLIPYDRTAENTVHRLVRTRFFDIDLLVFGTDFDEGFGEEHFHVLNVVEGGGRLEWAGAPSPLSKGDCVLVPRAVGDYRIRTGGLRILKSFL